MLKKSSASVKVFYPRFCQEEVLERLAQGVKTLEAKLPLRSASLFGSWASNRHTVASDIDVLVIYEGDPRADAYAIIKRTLELPGVEPHAYSEDEAKQMESTIRKMTRQSIVIYPKAKP